MVSPHFPLSHSSLIQVGADARPTALFPRRWLALAIAWMCAALPGFGQTFLAEWNASAEGGIAPTGMALGTESGATFLYVCDEARGRIVKFDTATGAVAAVLGQAGAGNGEFSRPYGIAIDPATGDLYVAERGNHRVQRITNAGTFVTSWGGLGTAVGQFTEPVGVAVDAAGDVYVTENANHRVQKFRVAQAGGVWAATNLAAWGAQGSGDGQLNFPYGIAVDAAGSVWVADGFNGRVQKFDTTGAFQAIVGSSGTGPGQFVIATWASVGPGGDMLVSSTNSNPQDGTLADANNQWISRFTPAGAFVSRWGGEFGSGPGQFRLPFQAVVDAANRAYVADYYNGRVQIFDLSATSGGGGGTGRGGGSGPDTTAPTIASFTTGTATASSVTFALTFSEAVTGVDSADFTAVTTGGATATIGAVSGTGASYTIPVAFSGTGTVAVNLEATGTGIADTAGNALAGGASGPVYTIPTGGGGGGGGSGGSGTQIVAVTTPADGTYIKGEELIFTVRFSNPVTLASRLRGAADDDRGKGRGASKKNGKGKGRDDDDDDDRDDDDEKKRDRDDDDDDEDDKKDSKNRGDRGDDDDKKDDDKKRDEAKGRDSKDEDDKDDDGDKGPGGPGKGDDDRDEDGDEKVEDALYFTWSAVGSVGARESAGKVKYRSGSGTDTLTFRYKVKNGDSAPNGILLGTSLILEDDVLLHDASGAVLTGAQLAIPWITNPLPDVIIAAERKRHIYAASSNGRGRGHERLVNLSSRLRVTGGDANRSVFAGFVVTGEAPKPILIRAVGPSLRAFGVGDALSRPRLQLRDSTGRLIAENGGWNDRLEISLAGDRVGAFKLDRGSDDAALLVALEPGAYTVQIASNGNGVVLLEIYDASDGSKIPSEQITNISTRGYIGSGDDALVAGFVVTGNASRRVLIRGVGPTLANFGVDGALSNPVLQLYRTGRANPIAQNDDWETPQPADAAHVPATAAEIAAATSAAGAFPLGAGSMDAAILVVLPPGSYSAVVSGAGGTTGGGLVEVYEAP